MVALKDIKTNLEYKLSSKTKNKLYKELDNEISRRIDTIMFNYLDGLLWPQLNSHSHIHSQIN